LELPSLRNKSLKKLKGNCTHLVDYMYITNELYSQT
jgi:hypothetical protein